MQDVKDFEGNKWSGAPRPGQGKSGAKGATLIVQASSLLKQQSTRALI